MKREFLIGLIAVALAAGQGAAPGQKSGQPEAMLRAAMDKETVDGDLKAAIEVYRKIVQQGGGRATVAKALLRMGQCQEKLGQAEARKAYERLVREFSDQRETAAEARTRLAALGASPAPRSEGMVARQLWSGKGVHARPALSPDGRFFVFTDDATGDLTLREIATGQMRRLTRQSAPWTYWAESPAVSPDGKQVAYGWNHKQRFHARQAPWAELRVVSVNGDEPEPRVLLRDAAFRSIQPVAWSPDSTQILAVVSQPESAGKMDFRIVWISLGDGSVRLVHSLGWRAPGEVSLSPDGRYIVYSATATTESPESDIFLVSADGGSPIGLVEHPADDFGPVWTPDGSRVIFASNRAGNTGAWAVTVADGKPQGPAELVKADLGRIMPIGFTREGSYYYGLITRLQDVWAATLDPATGKALGPVERLSERVVGSNGGPSWSPDGRFLAYYSGRGRAVTGTPGIVIRNTRTGEERDLSPGLNPGGPVRWFRDGRSLLVPASDNRSRLSFHRVDTQTGAATLLHGPIDNQVSGHLGLSPDGTTIYYQIADRPNERFFVRALDVASRQEREVCRMADVRMAVSMALSGDGRRLALAVLSEDRRATSIRVVPVTGGEVREIFRAEPAEEANRQGGIAWTPDGRYVIFERPASGDKQELWRVPADGGAAESLGLMMDQITHPSLHPDGSRIAFTAASGAREVWMLTNLLARLAPGPAHPAGFSVRQVWSHAIDAWGTPSADGRYLSFVDWTTGDLAVRDLTTGQNRRLTNKGPWETRDAEAEGNVLSPDGRQVAFGWNQYKANKYELRVINTDGTGERVLYQSLYVEPHAWTPDGRSIIANISPQRQQSRIALISVADGTARILKPLDSRWPGDMSVSPDGRYLAYDTRPDPNTPAGDIFLLDLAAGSGEPGSGEPPETPLVAHPAHDQVLGWSPDGRYILFASDRSGTTGAWLLPVANGKPSGPPVLVKPNMGEVVIPMGFTARGSYFYGVRDNLVDARIGTLEPDGFQLKGPPAPVALRGATSHPVWTADGRYLAYRSGQRALMIRAEDSGEERELAPQLAQFERFTWHPDGRSLLVTGISRAKRAGVFQVDVTTGEATEIVRSGPSGGRHAVLSPDGRTLYYTQPGSWHGVAARNLATGEERVVYRAEEGSDGIWTWSLSRDGRFLALGLPRAIRIVPAAGGEFRERIRLGEVGTGKFFGVDWTPDGRYLVAAVSIREDKKHHELWRIPVEGGEPQKVSLPGNYIAWPRWAGLRVHPDGLRFALTSVTMKQDVWAMENFLPAERAAR
ncbi:MAG: tetratricopeptide repeat protein [Acidobacteriota bacterium]